MAVRKKITELRKEIDSIDQKLVRMVSRRARTAQLIGAAKNAGARSVLDVGREKTVLAAMREANDGPLSDEGMEAIFREIISACRASQEPISVAFLGPDGTFSHSAALKQFGHTSEFRGVDTIDDVFAEVEAQRARYGVVPVENTTEGAVTPTLDALARTRLRIVAEIVVPVQHFLIAKLAETGKVKRVASHPQPLAQCRHYLAKHFPGVELIPSASTAAAAKLAARQLGTAAIASKLAAEIYGLRIVARSIQDQAGNVTRFLVVGDDPPAKATGDDRTSLVIAVQDKVGILGRILTPFTDNKVNLSMIESRPLAGRPWEYRFFVDVAGHSGDRKVVRALAEIDKIAISTKVLGSYPVAG